MTGEGVPEPDGAHNLDDFASALVQLREYAGLPSYGELVRRIARIRAARGLPIGERAPGRVTVYECFQPGRRRVDVALVTDLVLALGLAEDEAARWSRVCRQLQGRTAGVVATRSTLPPPVPTFVGRADEMAALLAATGPVVIDGMAGSGKTQLALRAGQQLSDRGLIDLVLFANLRGHDPQRSAAAPAAVIDQFLQILKAPTASGASRTERFRQLVAGRRVLVVLDDAATADQVLPLLAPGRIWITSRRDLGRLKGAGRIQVPPLGGRDTLELLGAIAGPARFVDDAAAGDIVRLTGGLPLAVSLAGAQIARQQSWSLADHRDRLQLRRRQLRLDDGLTATLDVSYAGLARRTQAILRAAALHPGDQIGTAEIAVLAGTDTATARFELTVLQRENLVLRVGPDRHLLHDLVRAHATLQALEEDSATSRHGALNRLLDHYIRRCVTAMTALHPQHEADWHNLPTAPEDLGEQADHWLDGELLNILAAVRAAIECDQPERAVQLWVLVAWRLYHHGQHVDQLSMYDAVSLAAERCGNTQAAALIERNCGYAASRHGDDALARRHYHSALASFRTHQDRRNEAAVLNGLGGLDIYSGEPDRAIEHLTQAIRIQDQLGRRSTAALNNLAVAYFRTGRHDEAMQCYEQSIRLSNETGDLPMLRVALSNSSGLAISLGQLNRATELAT
ncbi:tetratricopeptide repeat protein [Kribbella sp. NPDC056861]|uniref:tetratricopeptide repeat protein n=1 Tax=Kribbella sp. NPDC056861 TaxID=3154857 RepID=UPI0034193D4F